LARPAASCLEEFWADPLHCLLQAALDEALRTGNRAKPAQTTEGALEMEIESETVFYGTKRRRNRAAVVEHAKGPPENIGEIGNLALKELRKGPTKAAAKPDPG
jgi:hypothetical protein